MVEKQENSVLYYPIREDAARRTKEMNSFSDYKEGSATAEYRRCVDQAVEIAKQQKEKVDPIYHGKIDALVDNYARKLADNMNRGFEIDARVPSVMVARPSNFPTGKKEKQNAARAQNMEEWRQVQGILDKIKGTGMGGISADNPHAVEQLEKQLEGLEKSQQVMKEVNAYYRKYQTLDGCTALSTVEIEKLKVSMEQPWHLGNKPFQSFALSNNSAEIRRIKARIAELKQYAEERSILRKSGFKWAPSVGAWQRQLNHQAISAAGRIEFIRPLSGEHPRDLQPKAKQSPGRNETVR